MTSPDLLDAIQKRTDLDAALHAARGALQLDTLATRRSDALDFHTLAVWQVREALRGAFEAGYISGLRTGYRQGRSDAASEAAGGQPPITPRNPPLPN